MLVYCRATSLEILFWPAQWSTTWARTASRNMRTWDGIEKATSMAFITGSVGEKSTGSPWYSQPNTGYTGISCNFSLKAKDEQWGDSQKTSEWPGANLGYSQGMPVSPWFLHLTDLTVEWTSSSHPFNPCSSGLPNLIFHVKTYEFIVPPEALQNLMIKTPVSPWKLIRIENSELWIYR